MSDKPRAVAPGYTLIEMVLSLALTSIILGGMVAAVMVAGRSLPSETDPTLAGQRIGRALDTISHDITYAVEFTHRSARAIEFKIADRDADGFDETIRYEWSGTPGDALMRSYNGASPSVALDNVHDLAFDYVIGVTSREQDGAAVRSGEVVLFKHGVFTSDASFNSYNITKDNWVGQYLTPSLPRDAVSWRPTRFQFRAQQEGPHNETTLAQLRSVTADGLPSATVLEEQTIVEIDLPTTYATQEVVFTGTFDMSPAEPLALVLVHSGKGADSMRLVYDDAAGRGLLETQTAGASWTHWPGQAIVCALLGTYETPGTSVKVDVYRLRSVHVTLRAGSEGAQQIATSIAVLNAPQIPPP